MTPENRGIRRWISPSVLLAAGAILLAAPREARGRESDYPHGKFRADCRMCHAPDSWSPVVLAPEFDHANFGFPHDGAHRDTPCLLCHVDLEFAETTGTTCAGCHQDVHAGEFGVECDRCHSTQSFVDRGDEIRSHRMTRFPLTGAHLAQECSACHGPEAGRGMGFVNTPTECVACHGNDYQATSNPNHVQANFPRDCAECHSTITWGGSQFDHALTGFPLTGAHRTMDCQQCHVGYVFSGTSQDCYSCHRPDYESTSSPNHVAGGYSTQCAACHDTRSWSPANVDHSLTAFPLTGAHRAVACQQCHTNDRYAGTPQDCYSCHRPDYEAARNPDHIAGGYAIQCGTCHDTRAWRPAAFDHTLTAFPLTGVHATIDCSRCHGDGVYSGKDPACVACHLADYQATTNPNHAGAGFGTDCAACHGTSQWGGADFDHDARFFPIYSGPHKGKWQSCSTCHENPGNFGVFTCFNCHKHDKTPMDDNHRGVNGYQYDPQACYSCHPQGRK